MCSHPQKIIACRSLAPFIESIQGTAANLTVLEVGLHVDPARLRQALLQTIAQLEEEGATIILGYGLCGRSLEGVVSEKSTLIVPRIDDCIGMLLGSRSRHRQVMADHPGTYFLDANWLDSDMNIFIQINKGMEHLPEERRRQIAHIALQHYTRLVLLEETQQTDAEERCRRLAEEHDLEFRRLDRDFGLLERLVCGPWTAAEFVIVPPGTPIPHF